MKIYTGFGDKGYTALIGGEKVRKNNKRVEIYGSIDELNSTLGIVRAKAKLKKTQEIIAVVQNRLFNLSTEIAAPIGKMPASVKAIDSGDIKKAEQWIDEINTHLPELKNFILPGGTEAASFIHFSRTVARRTERLLAGFMEKHSVRDELLVYLNRLSDLLFVLARFENIKSGKNEIFWQP